jgi:hypothetical protein
MLRFPHKSVLVGAVLIAGIALPCQAGSIDDIDLCWKPSIDLSDLTDGMAPLGKVKVSVKPFTDSRFQPQVIGEARLAEKDGATPQVTTSDSVANWVTVHLADSLDDAGLKLGDGGPEISGEVVQFFAVKAPDYNGDVQLRINVSRGGEVIWRGLVSGWARQPDDDWDKGKGKSYCRILSDAMQRAVASLVWYPKFREAIGAAPLPPPPPPPPDEEPPPAPSVGVPAQEEEPAAPDED